MPIEKTPQPTAFTSETLANVPQNGGSGNLTGSSGNHTFTVGLGTGHAPRIDQHIYTVWTKTPSIQPQLTGHTHRTTPRAAAQAATDFNKNNPIPHNSGNAITEENGANDEHAAIQTLTPNRPTPILLPYQIDENRCSLRDLNLEQHWQQWVDDDHIPDDIPETTDTADGDDLSRRRTERARIITNRRMERMRIVSNLRTKIHTMRYDSAAAAKAFGEVLHVVNNNARVARFNLTLDETDLATGLPPLPADVKSLTLLLPDHGIHSLDNLPEGLLHLDVRGVEVPRLPPVSTWTKIPSSLHTLIVSLVDLAQPPSFHNKLRILELTNCGLGHLSSLPAELEILNVSGNHLTTLPDPLPKSLQELRVNHNELSTLSTLPPDMKTVNVSDNKLSTLPFIPAGVTYLKVSRNQLTRLPDSIAKLAPQSIINIAGNPMALHYIEHLRNSMMHIQFSDRP